MYVNSREYLLRHSCTDDSETVVHNYSNRLAYCVLIAPWRQNFVPHVSSGCGKVGLLAKRRLCFE